ncbi:type IV secretory system conjugative DNA transfer family protein [Halorientalis regularis]|uniref:TraM recognition site of TraD and TraG n=1 Tax=Halorientalis regularis TaxID=660518 RepID=A0A1G7JWX9_9EURY|nr:TraM recognition domain-containing protein [Halorientalis regularis]SDF29450.1 TraM recognition site of TraD and TraG [Halorientalis regularis]
MSDATDETGRGASVERIRDAVDAVVTTLDGRQLAAPDREPVAEAVLSVLVVGDRLTVDSVALRHVPPDADPSASELATTLAEFGDAFDPTALRESVSDRDLRRLAGRLDDLDERVADAEQFPYEFVETAVEHEHGQPVRSLGYRSDDAADGSLAGATESVFAGPRAREQIEQVPRENPDAPLFVGTGTRAGRDASIEKDHLFRHRAIFGVTGYGKSTLLTNEFKQLVEAGAGGCFVDPKGDDSERLVEILPERRLDELRWLEPGSSRGAVSGFNFLELDLDPADPAYETALAALIEDLVALLGVNEVWGPHLNQLASETVTAVNAHNRARPDEPDLTLVDFAHLLTDPAARERFAERVAAADVDLDPDYADRFGAVPEATRTAVREALVPWIENPITRRLVAARDSEISVPRAVADGEILLVRMGGEPKELKRKLSMAVLRRIWSAIRARAERDRRDRDPFYLFCDEFDNVALADETITAMLSKSRSYRLSLTFCTQYPGQLPESVVEGLVSNCDTVVSFNPGSRRQAETYNSQLGVDVDTLTGESNYHAWLRTTLSESMERSAAFRVYTHPPFPPVRTRDERDRLIERALARDGWDPVDDPATSRLDGGDQV